MGIEETIKNVPSSPGIYLFYGKNKKPLYIGKASNLKKRITSYFQNKYHPPKTRALVSHIRDLDYIVTSSSEEALIYESRLVKEEKPKYNVELKDDKSYPFLKLTVNEKFPRLLITRGRKKDGALYCGPYTDAGLLKKAHSMINDIFLLRSCRKMPKKACLKAQIKQCIAPCNGSISEADYRNIVRDVKLFLGGKKKTLLRQLSARMSRLSDGMEYEKALAVREKIEALSAMWRGKKPPPPLNKEISELKEVLGLKTLPVRIEAFDISHIHGKEAVGSMVSFFSGKPQKDEYRRFRIKGVRGIDDYKMIEEVIRRRYLRLLKERGCMPDLIVVDGGKGHLGAARRELCRMAVPEIPVVTIAKENEYIYTAKEQLPLRLPRRSPALKLIMRIRDEAHRFAISYHKLLRGKKFLRSAVDEINGVGKQGKKALVNRFGSLENIKKASLEELKRLEGMNEKKAQKIVRYFSVKNTYKTEKK